MAPVTQQTAVCTEQDTLRITIASREVPDGRQGDIIQEPARLEVTGSRQTPPVPLRATGINTTGGNTHASEPRRTSKRRLADLEADRAATEITDLVEQEGHHLTRYKHRPLASGQGTEHAPKDDRDISEVTTSDLDNDSNHKREDQEDDKVTIATDGIIPDDCDIPEWVIEESQVLSREVTPPQPLFFRDQGERQDGDCGPAAVIGVLYFVYCLTGCKHTELESLLTYRAIRQFARTHLQQRTLLKAAQVDSNQMLACQTELQCATKDLWTQVPE